MSSDRGSGDSDSDSDRVAIVVPVWNDWEAAGLLLERLDAALDAASLRAVLVFVDDGSSQPPTLEPHPTRLLALDEVLVVSLRRNLGHQRAIAIGLAYVFEQVRCRDVVVMDGDGEDRPEDVSRLLAHLRMECSDGRVVFAARTRRFESLTFRLSYHLYRAAHYLLTGIAVRVGNFSAMPFSLLSRVVALEELWNHYAAAVVKARIPHASIPLQRGARWRGRSKMSFVQLVTHGLSAISVFGEVVGVRVVIASTVAILLVLCSALVLALFFLVAAISTPPWVAVVLILLFVLAFQILMIGSSSLFFILYSRNQYGVIPLRDYRFFVDRTRRLAELDG